MSGERVVMLDNFHVTYLFTGTCTPSVFEKKGFIGC